MSGSTGTRAAAMEDTSASTAITIVGFGNASDVHTCLRSLQALNNPSFLVSICENGGPETYRTLIETLDDLVTDGQPFQPAVDRVAAGWRGVLHSGQEIEVLCADRNVGYAGGVNIAIRSLMGRSDWDAVWVLNPDCELDINALQALRDKVASDPRYGIIGSRLVMKKTGRVQAYGARWKTLTSRGVNIGLNEPWDRGGDAQAVEGRMDYIIGASMYLTRSFLETVGMMDESYFLYAEDVDWCMRRGPYKLGYADQSIVYHMHGSTLGSNPVRRDRSRLSVYLDERNRHLVARRFFPRLYPLIALFTLVFTGQYVRAAAWRNFLVAIEGWWAGVRGETGKPAWMR